MLRLIVLLLMLLNVGYFAWSEGWLRAYGWAPVQQREPERLAQQINPQALTVLTESAVAAAANPASAAKTVTSTPAMACLQSNALQAAQVDVLRPLLQSQFEPDAWQLDEHLPPPRWMVYMGKFANKAEQAMKHAQLTELKVKFETVDVATLAPGFSLSVHATQKAANNALAALAQRGVRTAKVVQVQDAAPSYTLRLTAADLPQPLVQALTTALETLTLTPCADQQKP